MHSEPSALTDASPAGAPATDQPGAAPLAPSPLDTWPPAWTPAAVVFDCDGMLVNTEAAWVELQDEYLARHGVAFDEETRRSITGRAAEVVIAAIAELIGKDPSVVTEELLLAHRTARREIRMVPMAGAYETVRAVAAVVPVAVASNSPREELQHKIDELGLAEFVTAQVAVEDVAAPKPAPDMYVQAARLLGTDPADCLAFEDSETGAEAALGAGMQLIAVPSLPGQDPRAPRRLTSLEDPVLRDWIAGWTRKAPR